MRILALETSLRTGSVALLDDEHIALGVDLPADMRSAQSLAPTIAAALKTAGWRARDVQLVAVVHGPGSFTGLRVGVTTAKTFAYAVDAAVVGVNTLEVVAAQSTRAADSVWAVIDAQRSELFAARFVRGRPGEWLTATPTEIVGRDAWLQRLSTDVGVTGPGLIGLESRLPPDLMEPSSNWQPRAETVGGLGLRHYQAGGASDVWSLLPQYHRRSAAEEKSPHAQ